jgi:hypothetical protein
MLGFIRLVALCGMILACLCYVWDVIDHWNVVRSVWKGKSFSSYQEKLQSLLDRTHSRNVGFCLGGIAYCFAGWMAARQKSRKLAAAARKRHGSGRRVQKEGYLAPLTRQRHFRAISARHGATPSSSESERGPEAGDEQGREQFPGAGRPAPSGV